jgi:hypothetical protein
MWGGAMHNIICIETLFFFFFGQGWGIKLRASQMFCKCSTTELHPQACTEILFFFSVLGLELRAFTLSHSTSPFVLGIFKIGSLELFASADFEPQAS